MGLINNFERTYKELEDLLINKLPDNIEKINQEHHDGIILKPLENTKLEENCIKIPSFSFSIEEAEYTEKDRIIENTIYTISLEIKLAPDMNKAIIIYRYFEAINITINESLCWQECKIINTKKNRIVIKITV